LINQRRQDAVLTEMRAPSRAPQRQENRLVAKPLARQCIVQIYLPIADIPVNIFLLLAMGLAVGFISGMFGI
jgi:uncharacterized protein